MRGGGVECHWRLFPFLIDPGVILVGLAFLNFLQCFAVELASRQGHQRVEYAGIGRLALVEPLCQYGKHMRGLCQHITRGVGVEACGEFQEYRSEEHTSELQSLMRSSYAVFCLKKKTTKTATTETLKTRTSIILYKTQ